MAEFTLEEKIKELDREIMQRHRVYRRLIERGQLKRETATRQLAILTAIKTDYENKAKEGPLFR